MFWVYVSGFWVLVLRFGIKGLGCRYRATLNPKIIPSNGESNGKEAPNMKLMRFVLCVELFRSSRVYPKP